MQIQQIEQINRLNNIFTIDFTFNDFNPPINIYIPVNNFVKLFNDKGYLLPDDNPEIPFSDLSIVEIISNEYNSLPTIQETIYINSRTPQNRDYNIFLFNKLLTKYKRILLEMKKRDNKNYFFKPRKYYIKVLELMILHIEKCIEIFFNNIVIPIDQIPPTPTPMVGIKWLKINTHEYALKDNNECSICLENFNSNDQLLGHIIDDKTIHVFHNICISDWLNNSNKKGCPICRRQYGKKVLKKLKSKYQSKPNIKKLSKIKKKYTNIYN